MVKNLFSLLFLLSMVPLFFPKAVLAVCPVCTVAVGAGLGLSRYLGIDDLVSGVWIGGLILSMSFWMIDWLSKRGIKKPYLTLVVIVLMYALVVVPLQWAGLIGNPFNKLFGIDKLLLGTTAGSLVFIGAVRMDKLVRKLKGKQLFYYQKVVFPVLSLIITSLIFFLITKKP